MIHAATLERPGHAMSHTAIVKDRERLRPADRSGLPRLWQNRPTRPSPASNTRYPGRRNG